jgi:hypothetical protein
MVRMLISASLMVLLMVGIPLPAFGMGLAPNLHPMLGQTATTDFTDQEISDFATAYRSIQNIKQDAEADMVKAVEAEGLSVEQFNSIVDNQLDSETGTLSNASEEDTAKFESAVDSIIAIRQSAEIEMEAAIANEGISVERFNQIIDQAAQDDALKQQISDQFTP